MIKMLRPFLAKLSNREKMAIGIGIGFVGIFVLLQVAVFPFIDARERLQRRLVSHTRSYDEIKQLRLKYLALQNRADDSKTQFNRRQRGFTLFSFLDKLAGQVGYQGTHHLHETVVNETEGRTLQSVSRRDETEWHYHGADHQVFVPDRNITKHDSCPAIVPQQEGRERRAVERDTAGRNI